MGFTKWHQIRQFGTRYVGYKKELPMLYSVLCIERHGRVFTMCKVQNLLDRRKHCPKDGRIICGIILAKAEWAVWAWAGPKSILKEGLTDQKKSTVENNCVT